MQSIKVNRTVDSKKMVLPVVIMLAFWILAAVVWISSGEILALFFFGYIGASIGLGLGLYAALPDLHYGLCARWIETYIWI